MKLRLIPDELSHDTVEALRAMLSDAEQGKMIGTSFVALYRRGEYIVNNAGLAYREPSIALGPVHVLAHQLIALEFGK